MCHSLNCINYFIKFVEEPHLIDGRTRFIEEHDGQRYKLIAKDGNSIDVISVDRRKKYIQPLLIII